MTVYIAICDNNAADRKHLERMLEREKDIRLKENYDVLYIDSFGSEEALMQTPIKYDIFFIDITEGSRNGMDIAKALRNKGISSPIVLCESTVNYTSYVNAPKELVFINKPLNAGQISHLVDVAFERSKTKLPLIEIRCQKETRFIDYTELVRAVRRDTFVTDVSLSDGTFLQSSDSIESLYRQCISYGCFTLCRKDIVNVLHVDDCTKDGLKLSNGDIVPFKRSQMSSIISAMSHNLRNLRGK